MSPDAQRIALARACQFRGTPENPVDPEFASYYLEKLPDYPNDLEAVRDAEAILDEEQVEIYERQLIGIAGGLSQLSAAQRAEALLKTLELWKS